MAGGFPMLDSLPVFVNTGSAFVARNEYLRSWSLQFDAEQTRDIGSGNLQILRAGLLFGKITASGLMSPTLIGGSGVVASAYNGGTTLTVSAACAAEIVRRIGATGTLTLGGPPTASGVYRQLVATYSGVDTSTGAVTVTALNATSTYTIVFPAGADGGTFQIRVTYEDGTQQTTAAITITGVWATDAASTDAALEALSGIGTGGVAVTTPGTDQLQAVFVSTLGNVKIEVINNVVTDGGVFEGNAVVTQTVVGVDGRFIAGSFVMDTDGSQTPLGIAGPVDGNTEKTSNQFGTVLQGPVELVVCGEINTTGLPYWPSNAVLAAYLRSTLRSTGYWIFSDQFA